MISVVSNYHLHRHKIHPGSNPGRWSFSRLWGFMIPLESGMDYNVLENSVSKPEISNFWWLRGIDCDSIRNFVKSDETCEKPPRTVTASNLSGVLNLWSSVCQNGVKDTRKASEKFVFKFRTKSVQNLVPDIIFSRPWSVQKVLQLRRSYALSLC